MSAPLRQGWTQAQFLAWTEHQVARHEFDGTTPVAMTGGTVNHGLITQNLHAALRPLLRGTGCRALGPDVGVATRNDAVRYPDALVTCAPLDGTALLAPGAVAIFEVVSPSTARTDRILKVQEYAAIATMRRYMLVESRFVGVTVFSRESASESWSAATFTDPAETIPVLASHMTVKLADIYDDVVFIDQPEN